MCNMNKRIEQFFHRIHEYGSNTSIHYLVIYYMKTRGRQMQWLTSREVKKLSIENIPKNISNESHRQS